MDETKPRLMSAGEIAGFLARNPSIGARVAVTEAALASGLYDFNIYDSMWELGTIVVRFPGVIEPRGIQIQDSSYGLVTIQPSPAGLFFSAYSPALGDAGKPNYNSPSGNTGWSLFGDAVLGTVVIGIAAAVILAVVLARSK